MTRTTRVFYQLSYQVHQYRDAAGFQEAILLLGGRG